ncbi:terpene synthase family protein [Streptomyces qinzhouensis]|uniref:Terpene synthase n=1 Tax=Streptomyces qinzhouensis TaxID=2599401 RepID=A0A5B8J8C7_9ACTN|nr:terpene synthase family protein [Streptomyces qinzhouensis]QDY77607.1 hypothetical protein FQU76_14935 [Streptomyces qinzhouensis]
MDDSDELRGLVMPELYLPMPPHEPNPSYRQAYDAMWQWADSFELFTDAKAWEVGGGRLAYTTALAHPWASPERLITAACVFAYAYWIDMELSEGAAAGDFRRCGQVVDPLVEVIDGGKPKSRQAEALADVLTRMEAGRSPGWVKRYRQSWEDYFVANYRECVVKHTGSGLTLAQHTDHRRHSSATAVSVDLGEYGLDIDVPETVRRLPAWNQLRLAVVDHTGFSNDLIGFPRELSTSDPYNGVLILWRERGCSLQEAADAFNDEALTVAMRHAVTAHGKLPRELECVTDDEGVRRDAMRFADSLLVHMRGMADAQLSSARFSGPGFEPPPRRRPPSAGGARAEPG